MIDILRRTLACNLARGVRRSLSSSSSASPRSEAITSAPSSARRMERNPVPDPNSNIGGNRPAGRSKDG